MIKQHVTKKKIFLVQTAHNPGICYLLRLDLIAVPSIVHYTAVD